MRVFMLTLIVGLTCTASPGYNYQIEMTPPETFIEALPNHYQFLQQEQQQPQNVYQGQISQLQQPESEGAYQFGNQILQNAQQVIQYEEQHQQEPVKKQQLSQRATPIIEQPAKKIVETKETPQPIEKLQIVSDMKTELLINSQVPNKPEVFYQAPVNEKPVTFQKEFFYLSAPKEEEDATSYNMDKQLSMLQKKLRVVFIKAPESNGIENAALQLAQQAANSQTAIYVLTKQHDASELAQKFQSIQSSKPQSPEVAFIKYRTPEEAEHAQRVIQAQYELFDGPNHINRPESTVTLNFVGSNAVAVDPRTTSSVAAGEKPETTKPVSKYLPASVRH